MYILLFICKSLDSGICINDLKCKYRIVEQSRIARTRCFSSLGFAGMDGTSWSLKVTISCNSAQSSWLAKFCTILTNVVGSQVRNLASCHASGAQGFRVAYIYIYIYLKHLFTPSLRSCRRRSRRRHHHHRHHPLPVTSR